MILYELQIIKYIIHNISLSVNALNKMKGKGKGKPKKRITINDKPVSLGGKKCYMMSNYWFQYLDTNNVGDLFFGLTNPIKWEFIKSDIDNACLIRHIPTQLYLTTNEKGDVFTSVDLQSTFQKWWTYPTSEAEVYAYQNCANELWLHISPGGELYMDLTEETPEEKAEKLEKDKGGKNSKKNDKGKKAAGEEKEKTGLFKTFQFFPKK